VTKRKTRRAEQERRAGWERDDESYGIAINANPFEQARRLASGGAFLGWFPLPARLTAPACGSAPNPTRPYASSHRPEQARPPESSSPQSSPLPAR